MEAALYDRTVLIDRYTELAIGLVRASQRPVRMLHAAFPAARPTYVYRIERADGTGPFGGWAYVAAGKCDRARSVKSRMYDMPDPCQDSEYGSRADLYGAVDGHGHFAFIDRKCLEKYFDRDVRKLLRTVGFVLTKYEVPAITWIGNSGQCTFEKSTARLVWRKKLA